LTATLRPFLQKGSDGVAQATLSVKKIKDLLRLHLIGGISSRRQLGQAGGVGSGEDRHSHDP